jgi:hypothetical protein
VRVLREAAEPVVLHASVLPLNTTLLAVQDHQQEGAQKEYGRELITQMKDTHENARVCHVVNTIN